jgi:hypothetical protein
MNYIYYKIHVSGASASCPGVISSDKSSDEDMTEVKKTPDNDDVKLAVLKKSKPEKRNARTPLVVLKRRMRKAHYFQKQEHIFEDRNYVREDVLKC